MSAERDIQGQTLDVTQGPIGNALGRLVPVVTHSRVVKPAVREAVVATVRSWWPDVARDLPWRTSRDPWEILVSEVMAQQTQVDRVIPKWQAFIERFPTPVHAAEAAAGDLISMWDGLGYNRRALYLHKCAQAVVNNHGGSFPNELAELLALPGVGPYTARAVQAFAFEADVAVVDTNVGRVLARVAGGSLSANDAQEVADSLVPAGAGWEWNQAFLDFGAMMCTKRSPQCPTCPLRDSCAWAGVGPDPAVGSAGVSKAQARFEGSNRQARGRLVARLRDGSIEVSAVGSIFDFADDAAREESVLASLIDDGMVVEHDGWLSLP